MTGRQISKASHRMSGDVFVVRPVPSSISVSDERLERAADRDNKEIDDLKQDLREPEPRNGDKA